MPLIELNSLPRTILCGREISLGVIPHCIQVPGIGKVCRIKREPLLSRFHQLLPTTFACRDLSQHLVRGQVLGVGHRRLFPTTRSVSALVSWHLDASQLKPSDRIFRVDLKEALKPNSRFVPVVLLLLVQSFPKSLLSALRSQGAGDADCQRVDWFRAMQDDLADIVFSEVVGSSPQGNLLSCNRASTASKSQACQFGSLKRGAKGPLQEVSVPEAADWVSV